MTYEQAEEFMLKYDHVRGQLVEKTPVPFYIRHILIAPKEAEDKITILNENIYKPIDNETALKNLGMLNKNLDVYIIGGESLGQKKQDEILYTMNLYSYLRETGQLL